MPGALRAFTIGLTAFLTVIDLFATQAILPALTASYGVTPAAMGFAVNASTIGMAIGGLAVGERVALERKLDPGETPVEAALRDLQEQVSRCTASAKK